MIKEIIFLALGLKSLFELKPERKRVLIKANNGFESGTNIGSSL